MTPANHPSATPSDGRSEERPRRLQPAELLAFGAAWLPYALLVRRFWFVTDDSFISFRYAKNFALGHGLRYNLGDHTPVEGYSNLLWTLACALVEALRGDVTFWAPLASFALGSWLLYRVFFTLRVRAEEPLPVALIATLGLGLFPPYFVWSTGGLETMAFALVAFLSFETVVLRAKDARGWQAVLCGVALVSIRVEGLAWVGLIAGAALVTWLVHRIRATGQNEGAGAWLRTLVVFVVAASATAALQALLRFAYYDSLTPNTAVVKVAMSAGTLARGWDYAATYYLTFVTPLLLLPLAAFSFTRRAPSAALGCAGLAVVPTFYAIAASGDFMAMGRLFVVGLSFGALLAGSALGVVWRRAHAVMHRRLLTAIALAAIGLGALPALGVHVVPQSVLERHHFRYNTKRFRSEYEQWRFMQKNVEEWSKLGRVAARHCAPGDSITLGPIGAFGYYSNLFIYDRNGLTSREVALRPAGELRSPGHDKSVERAFFLPHEPTYLRMNLVKAKKLSSPASRAIAESDSLAAQGAHYYADVQAFDDDRFLVALKRAASPEERAARTDAARKLLQTRPEAAVSP